MTIHEHGYWIGAYPQAFDSGLVTGLVELFKGKSVVDFGCGAGLYVKHFRKHQIECDGFDGNPATPERSDGTCGVLDLAYPVTLPLLYDWVLCLEVGEHIPAAYQETLLDTICKHAKEGVVLSWAIPGQIGVGHVNCLDNRVIVRAMAERGFVLDPAKSAKLRTLAKLPWFPNTVMVFNRKVNDVLGSVET
jgi:SAM-dependent methyltransferase